MILQQNTGLVSEGGGMRGVFTAGVLDCFLDRKIYFPYAIGVSAGASNGLSYVSRQRGRARACDIDILQKYRYIGVRHLLRQRNWIDFNFLFDELPSKILPYDFEACFNSSTNFEMVTSNCQSGKAEYFSERSDPQRLLTICRASSSLPFISPIVHIDGKPMLDGGICDPIPVKRSVALGHTQNVVVLTREKGYRKEEKVRNIPFVYHKYPALKVQMLVRPAAYNQTLAYIEKEEEAGNLVVIRPEKSLLVDRLEQNAQKLADLYQHGYDCAQKMINENDLSALQVSNDNRTTAPSIL